MTLDEAHKLRVYENDVDTVIAYSPSDASDVYLAHSLEKREDYPHLDDEWIEVPPDRVMRIHDYRGDGLVVEMTAAQFVADNGRGFLCSTEF